MAQVGPLQWDSTRVQLPSGAANVVNIDAGNASGAIMISGRAFVNAANDLFGGVQTTRWNRSRLIRIGGHTPTSLRLQCQGIPGGAGVIGVSVNGATPTVVNVVNTDAVPRWYIVNGLPTGAKTIDIYDDFQDRGAPLNSGTDGPALGTYCLAVELYGGAITKLTASTIIVAFGDSHIDGQATAPISYNGWGAQLRRRALAAGMAFGYAGAGSSTLVGDGLSATDVATEINDLRVQAGAMNLIFLMCRRPNDWPDIYYGHTLTTSATTYGTFVQNVQTNLDGLAPGWKGVYTRIPQGTGWGANAGGFTRNDYWNATVAASTANGRTNVRTFDGDVVFVAAGLSLSNPAHFFEASPNQVHLAQPGHDIVASVTFPWFGL